MYSISRILGLHKIHFHHCLKIKHSKWITDFLSNLWICEKNTSFSFHFKVWNLYGSCLSIWFSVESRIHLSLPPSNLLLTSHILSNPCFTLIWKMFGFPIPLHLDSSVFHTSHFLILPPFPCLLKHQFHQAILIILRTIDRNFFTDFRHWRIAGICWQDVKPYSGLGMKETVARDDNF
jgi:hypothetical protein